MPITHQLCTQAAVAKAAVLTSKEAGDPLYGQADTGEDLLLLVKGQVLMTEKVGRRDACSLCAAQESREPVPCLYHHLRAPAPASMAVMEPRLNKRLACAFMRRHPRTPSRRSGSSWIS